MISIWTVLFIVIIHYVADFIMQAEVWATNKSKDVYALLKHTVTYSLVWFGCIFIYSGFSLFGSIAFTLVTFVLHTATDYYTSKIVSKRFAANYYGSPIPNLGAFSMIGADQVLHYVQLVLTYYLIF